jgi:hypothetical protein
MYIFSPFSFFSFYFSFSFSYFSHMYMQDIFSAGRSKHINITIITNHHNTYILYIFIDISNCGWLHPALASGHFPHRWAGMHMHMHGDGHGTDSLIHA